MKVAIRLDATRDIGTGHLARCLTLAEHLRRDSRASCVFVCASGDGFDGAEVVGAGHALAVLPPGTRVGSGEDARQTIGAIGRPDWVVVDHYGIDATWERHVARDTGASVCVIDDLADRPHACDVLVDQNFYAQDQARYEGRVTSGVQLFLGPENLLLRDEFEAARPLIRTRQELRRVLVFFGGHDAAGVTLPVVNALARLGVELDEVTVVVGRHNPLRGEIRDACASWGPARYAEQVDNMAELMAVADLAIGAGGATTLERCFMGLPAIAVDVADNQVETLEDLDARGALWHLGSASDDTPSAVASLLGRLSGDDIVQASRASLDVTAVVGERPAFLSVFSRAASQ